MNYSPDWSLESIPDASFYAEVGRRRGQNSPRKPQVFNPCAQCAEPLNATQWRKPCRFCEFRNRRKDWKVSK